jgi:hypothetical protein
MKQNWLSIYGNIEVNNGTISLIPVPIPPTTPNTIPTAPFALARSNIEFEQGTITLEFFLPNPDALCQISLQAGNQTELFAGINVSGAPYGFAACRNNQWEPIASTGHGSRLQAGWHELKLHAQGSNIDLLVNGVKVVSTSYRLLRGPISLFFQSYEQVSVRNLNATQQHPVCFVVMQFTDEYNALYEEVIKPTCESYGYTVIRADDYYTSGLIIDDITRSIREATVIIADITPNNPNVFYEVGFSHGIGKPTILLSDRKRERLPFDLSGFRTLFYDNTIGGKSSIEERLRKHLEAIAA